MLYCVTAGLYLHISKLYRIANYPNRKRLNKIFFFNLFARTDIFSTFAYR